MGKNKYKKTNKRKQRGKFVALAPLSESEKDMLTNEGTFWVLLLTAVQAMSLLKMVKEELF